MKYMYKVNDRIGHLVVVGNTGRLTKNGECVYRCKCDCGRIVEKNSHYFTHSPNPVCGRNCTCLKEHKSGNTHVSWTTSHQAWCVSIKRKGVRLCCKYFKNISDAVNYRDQVLAQMKAQNINTDLPETRNTEGTPRASRNTTTYIGVQKRESGKYTATHAGQFLGTFVTAEEAAKVYDNKIRELYGEVGITNFKEEE